MMGYINYDLEPRSDIAFIDMKSFYASVECIERGLNPLTTSLCVMSRADNSKGLILASSPTFKHVFGKQNVSRSYDLPFDIETRRFNMKRALQEGLPITSKYINYIESWAQRTLIVPPRMGLYIVKNIEIQQIFREYAATEDICPYSIDEGFIDLTRSINYFIPQHHLSRREKLDIISAKIQHDVWRRTGIFSTVGMSNANPLLAKLALDNEAKTTPMMRANWSYEEVPTRVWKLPKLTDFWGIGRRTARRLEKLKIYTIKDLAHANPDMLKKEFGIIGVQLWFHANGVDESNVREPYKVHSKGIGNSQILPRNYTKQTDIELLLSEMAEQVALRLRRSHQQAQCVSLYIGFAKDVPFGINSSTRASHFHTPSHETNNTTTRDSFQAQMKIEATQLTKDLTKYILTLFRKHYKGEAVRQIGVRYSQLVPETLQSMSLFDNPETIQKAYNLEHTIDDIRRQHGFLSVQKASALLEASRAITRSKLIGGHAAGGAGGLDGLL